MVNLPKRYDGRPILLVIENYALSVIGELDDDAANQTEAIVQHVWGDSEPWADTVRVQLGWTKTVDDEIRDNWQRYRETAKTQQEPAIPRQFAMMFADAIAGAANPDADGS